VTTARHGVGAYVLGAEHNPRALVRHADLLAAYADGAMLDRDESREAYLSHYVFGPEMRAHFAANRNSVADYAGPCRCRWLVLDIDRPDLVAALADARRLVAFLHERYPECEGRVRVYFSGGKGFHVIVELVHAPPPAVGFNAVCRTLAEALAARAAVRIDRGVYDVNRLIRLPNTRHPRTGLFKRRIDADALFRLDLDGVRKHARHPAGDGIPAVSGPVPQLEADWLDAVQVTAHAAADRIRRHGACAGNPDARAPRYFLDLLRFGVVEGERHATLFRCAAWLTEQGAPPSLCSALLTEAGCDVGLTPKDVERQIRCGVEHATRQRGTAPAPRPDPTAEPDAFERWAIAHESDPIPPGATAFLDGALASVAGEGGRA
jgi:hypothetical protein